MYGLPQVSMMMALGLFVFSLYTVPYQQLQRQMSWRHPSNSRVGKRPTRQFVGPGDDTITLTGVLYPEVTGGKISLAMVQSMADTGKAWPLIEGTGLIYGLFVVEEITQTHALFFPDGAPRKIEFTIKMTRVDEDTDLLGQAGGALLDFLDMR